MAKIDWPKRREWLLFVEGALLVGIIWGISAFVTHSRQPLKPQANYISSPWIPATVKKWQKPIYNMAAKYKVDPNLIAIIMTMESGGNPKAKSEAGAVGLMQITPLTAKDIANRYVKQPVSNFNLEDPNTNIEFGAAYLAKLRDIYGDWRQGPTWDQTVEQVAAAYNGGFGAANSLIKGQGMHDTQTVVYSRDALNMWRERLAKDSPTYDRWLERGGQTLIDNVERTDQQRRAALIRTSLPMMSAALAIPLSFISTTAADIVLVIGVGYNFLNNAADLADKYLIEPVNKLFRN